MKTPRGARVLIAGVLAAGAVHAVAGGALIAIDPIAALFDHRAPAVAAAAAGLAAARLFLLFVAPACAVHLLARAIVRAVYVPPK